MTDFKDLIASSGSPVGRLAAFRLLKDPELVKNDSSADNDLIAGMWKARGGLPFRLPTGKKTTVVLLSDIELFPVHEMAIGERKGTKGSYPQTEFFRSMSTLGVGDDGATVRSGNKCLLEQALGRGPKLIAVAKLLDTTPFKTREGKEVPWSVRSVVIPSNSSLLSVLAATSEAAKTSIQYMVFSVQRSMNEKSPKIGDSWTYTGKRVPEIMSRDGISAAEAAIDFSKGFPIPTAEQAMALIKKHVALCKRFAGETKNAVLTYDERGTAQLMGVTSDPVDALLNTEPATKPAGLSLTLEDLQDIASAPDSDDLHGNDTELTYN